MTGGRRPAKSDTPFLSLPRRDAIVELFLQTAKSTAGCAMCDRPIAPGMYRVSFVVQLPQPRVTGGRTRRTERHNIHAGCLLLVLEGRRVRTGRDCWDCGASPGDGEGVGHLHRCYTTSRFAYGPLCSDCGLKRRWRLCDGCEVHFPPHMVSPVVAIVEDIAEAEDFGPGMELCEWCAERGGMKTKKVADEERKNFDELRARIARGEVFRR